MMMMMMVAFTNILCNGMKERKKKLNLFSFLLPLRFGTWLKNHPSPQGVSDL
jgi:hypothetical protein